MDHECRVSEVGDEKFRGVVKLRARLFLRAKWPKRFASELAPTQTSPDFTQTDWTFTTHPDHWQFPHRRQYAVANMGRLHSNGKGISSSAIPYSRTPPAWLKTTPEQVVDQICKLAKKGATPSQIGVVLRDSHGIAQVKVVTGKLTHRWANFARLSNIYPGNKILRILKSSGTVHPVWKRKSTAMPLSFGKVFVALYKNCLCLVSRLTERFFALGLAPEIPEDLYMLIKKASNCFHKCLIISASTNIESNLLTPVSLGRRCPQASRAQPQRQGL